MRRYDKLLVLIMAVFFIAAPWPGARADRVTSDLVVLYDFTETEGTVIRDSIPIVPTLDLTIPDASKVEWLKPGLRVKEAIIAKASNARTKLGGSDFFTKGITIEVWVKPLNNTQGGPARIVTFSQDSGNRNWTLGQSAHFYQQRFRTSENPGNGTNPALTTPVNSIASTPVLQHVVYTRNAAGTASFYINKLKVQSVAVPGDGSNWVNSYGFGLFNETNYPTDDRTWLGDIFLVAIYEKDLTLAEIGHNYDAGVPTMGPTAEVDLAWDANTEEDLDGYKIFRGTKSRHDPAYKDAIKNWCTEHEPSNENCETEWKITCDDEADPACHPMLFGYEQIVDINDKTATSYTLKGLKPGTRYYLAAIAYDDEKNESAFSIELTHVANLKKLGAPEQLQWKEKEE